MSFNEYVDQFEKKINGFEKNASSQFNLSVRELINDLEANASEEKIQDVTKSLIEMGADIKLIGLKEILIFNLRSSANKFTNAQLVRAISQTSSNDFTEYVDQVEEFENDFEDDSDNGDEEYENAVDNEDLINWLDEYCYPSAIIEVGRYLAMEFGYKIKGRTSHRRVLARLRTLGANCDLDFDELHEAIEESVEFN